MSNESPAVKLVRLQRLAVLAERRMQERQRHWVAERRRLEALESQRRELSRFAADYRQPTRGAEVTLPTLFATRRGFVAGLHREAERIGVEIDRQRQRVDAARRAIARPAGEVAALERACERVDAARQLSARRAEQRGSDELTARRHVERDSRD